MLGAALAAYYTARGIAHRPLYTLASRTHGGPACSPGAETGRDEMAEGRTQMRFRISTVRVAKQPAGDTAARLHSVAEQWCHPTSTIRTRTGPPLINTKTALQKRARSAVGVRRQSAERRRVHSYLHRNDTLRLVCALVIHFRGLPSASPVPPSAESPLSVPPPPPSCADGSTAASSWKVL